jgi:protein SCO1
MKKNTVGVIAMAALFLWLTACNRTNAVAVDPPKPAPEIVGVDWNGQPFALSKQRGKVVVVTFGYTSCPDICPTTLSRLRKAVKGNGDVEVVFITVDPERDTKERLAAYVPAFGDDFHAPTLEPAMFQKVRDGFDVVATRHYAAPGTPDQTARYVIDHTSGIFVIDRGGKIRARLSADASPEDMRREIERLVEEGS